VNRFAARAFRRAAIALALLAVACAPADPAAAPRHPTPRGGGISDPGTGARSGGVARPAPAPARTVVVPQGTGVRLAEAGAPPPSHPAPLVVFLGDSLSAGLGLDVDQAYPALVGDLLAERGLPIRVLNAGLSGDTSAGGRERLDWFLRQKPDLVVVELGANDALRGQPLDGIEDNLRDILQRVARSGARAVLAGMKIPTNYGPDYSNGFEAIYPRVARETGATLIPFLLEGVAGDPALNQADGIHPTAEGQKIVARTVADLLAPLVMRLRESPAAAEPVR